MCLLVHHHSFGIALPAQAGAAQSTAPCHKRSCDKRAATSRHGTTAELCLLLRRTALDADVVGSANKFTWYRNHLGCAELIGNDGRDEPLLRHEDFAAAGSPNRKWVP